MEQLLLEVNWRTETKFLISLGETKTLLRDNDPGKQTEPVAVTGIKEPSPTIMEEGEGYREGEKWERVPGSNVMWEEAPESRYQSVACGWLSVIVLNVEVRDYWS